MIRDWRSRAASSFECEKRPAAGSLGMAVASHPLASAAGAEMLAEGGNAVDAAIASLFALTVVEPMMVGIVGGGLMHIRLPDGAHLVLDGVATAPAAATPTMFEPLDEPAGTFETKGARNSLGAEAVAVPGNLAAWAEASARFGRLPFADLLAPAIRYAERGFAVTPYLSGCIAEVATDLVRDPILRDLLVPDGSPLPAGARLVQGEAAETLRTIARDGAAALHGGEIGRRLVEDILRRGGCLSMDDLTGFRVIERAPVRGTYRGYEIVGPPPPASSGVHIVQMLTILEGYDIAGAGFGSAANIHLLAEVMKIAFADRAAATADPAFVEVPVERLISHDYADERRDALDLARAKAWRAGVPVAQPAYTTHVTTADRDGLVVAATHTINNLFGARFSVPGLGLIPNNYMNNFDPRPGRALSIAPGKRITTSMAPMMALREGRIAFALGLPGGVRIFASAMQALINLIDHGMSLQEAVEAPRVFDQGAGLEVEPAISSGVRAELEARGHTVLPVPSVAGGMNAIAFGADGALEGASCWRADGVPIGLGGGLARANVRFWPNQIR